MRIVFIGPPGAGKGTQAERLADRFDMDHLSSGDIFRAEQASGSELGNQLARYMAAGMLVPDDTVVRVMAKAVTESSAIGGLLLDGFPRTVFQAEALDQQLADAGRPLDAVVVIGLDDEAAVERISGRRVCPSTGRAYHTRFMPPRIEGIDDETGEKLIQRDDDTEEIVRARLQAYHDQTAPVIEYYYLRPDLKVIEIDGNQSLEEVNASLVEALQSLGAGRETEEVEDHGH